MKTPPFLMALALMFWGWQTGHFFWSLLMAGLIEAARHARRRLDFSDADLKRIWLLCLALQAGAALILYSTQDRMLFVFKFAQTLPVSFLPLMLAQAYCNREALPLSIFQWPITSHPESLNGPLSANISLPYFALCVLGASASTQSNAYFYQGVCVLVLAALTWTRPRRVGMFAWSLLAVAIVVGGYYSQQELRRIQNALEGALGGLIADMFHQPADARECRTSIGQPGELALSGRIIWRLTPDKSGFVPPLLRQAIYDGYRNETWSCSSNDFTPAPNRTADNYQLLPPKSLVVETHIAGYYENGEGLLAAPHGTFEVGNSGSIVRTNRLGWIDLENAPGLVDCIARWGPGASLDPPPSPADLAVDPHETNVMAQVVADLGLKKMSERQRIRALTHFFADRFTYTLAGGSFRHSGKTPLGVFLTETHRGHCEYFATATVLLLRMAGVPARYVTGFAVPENARDGATYVVRERHSHAWALAYHADNNTWEEVDTTPSAWAVQPAGAPWWEPLSDAGSNFYFRFSKWRWSKTSLARYASWLMAPLILSLAWRIIADQRGRVTAPASETGKAPGWPGLDSELFLIDRQLASANLSRQPGETLAYWQRRLESSETVPHPDRLKRIFDLHRTLRFDPIGLTTPERQSLREEAETWLRDFAEQNPKAKTRLL